MLADLSLVDCYNLNFLPEEERNKVMLYSAKRNLEKMAFFGLCEEQVPAQFMFQQTFGLSFEKAFVQFNHSRSSAEMKNLSPEIIERIRDSNRLDMELYAFGKDLFRKRFSELCNRSPDSLKQFHRLLKYSSEVEAKLISKRKEDDGKIPVIDKEKDKDDKEEDKELLDDSAGAYDAEKNGNSLEDYYSST